VFVEADVKVGVVNSEWKNLWAWQSWPGGEVEWVRSFNSELIELGCRYKVCSGTGSELFVEAREARKAGIKLVFAHNDIRYSNNQNTGSMAARMWAAVEQVNANADVIHGLWVADDVYREDSYAAHLRSELEKRLDPRIKVFVSDCNYKMYYKSIVKPYPDVNLSQQYPWKADAKTGARRPESEVQKEILEQDRVVASDTRVTPGIWVQGFGCTVPDDAQLPLRGKEKKGYGYHYRPPAGLLYKQMKTARDAGIRYIFVFTATWHSDPGDPWSGVWDHQSMQRDIKAGLPSKTIWKNARTRLWDEIHRFNLETQ
jgi:hypothetical protein